MSRATELHPELELLKPALEMAIIVARQGETAPVRIEAPRTIRPFLQFTRLPPRALIAARAALDDDEFRRRVADRSDEEEVGRAGWLLLSRPDGWSEEFDALVEERVARGDRHAEQSARRDLARAETTIDEQQRRIDALSRELDDLRAELDGVAARDEARAAEVAAAVEASETATAARVRAVRELKDMEQRLAQRTAEVRDLQARLDGGAVEVSPAPSVDPVEQPVDVAAVAALAADLTSKWRAIGPVLARLEGALELHDTAVDGRSRPARRRALRLGQGLVDGTVAAARWLLSQPGALVLVDGYNVTMLAWPDLTVADQRVSLERAGAVVQQRTGAQLVVFFDGDADGGSAVRAAVGSTVRVRFTDHDTEADDAILEAIAGTNAPVVIVVSNDRRVVDGARARGANVIRSSEFVTILRDA